MICTVCGASFAGRSDARTCSARCRKRLSRSKTAASVTSLDRLELPAELAIADDDAQLVPFLRSIAAGHPSATVAAVLDTAADALQRAHTDLRRHQRALRELIELVEQDRRAG